MPFGLTVHRVLQALDETLQVRHALFECLDAVRLWIAIATLRPIARRCKSPDLADPRGKSLAVAGRHRYPRRGGGLGGGG